MQTLGDLELTFEVMMLAANPEPLPPGPGLALLWVGGPDARAVVEQLAGRVDRDNGMAAKCCSYSAP
jgi:hypothetical protein